VRVFTSGFARVLASRTSCFRRVNGSADGSKEKFRGDFAIGPYPTSVLVTVLIVAHRGAHEPESPGVRENTLRAFAGAAGRGADGVELDVRRSADGVLVVVHDAVVDGLGAVADLPAAALPAWLPTLAAALDACRGLALVDVEIKNSPLEPGFDPGTDLAAAVAAAVMASPVARAALVTSFHLGSVDAVRAVAPTLSTGWLTAEGYDQGDAVTTAAARGHTTLAPPDASTTPALVSAAHAAGLRIAVWTVQRADRVRELATWGVDACITDRPQRSAAARG